MSVALLCVAGVAMDALLGFAELGWYAWGTATVAIVLVKNAIGVLLLGLAIGLLSRVLPSPPAWSVSCWAMV